MSDEKKSIWPMTDVQIAAIRERCDKATEGPWVVDLPDWGECNGISSKNGTQILNAGSCIPDPQTAVDHGGTVHDWKEEIYDYGVHKWDDAVFIAHAREDVPALLAEVARLQKVARLIGLHREAENQELRAEVARLEDEVASLEQELKFSDETEYALIRKLFDLKTCHKEVICEQADAPELKFEEENGCLFCWRQWAIRKAREAESEGE